MSDHKEDVNLIMSVLDELLDNGYHLVRDPKILKSDRWSDGWGGKSGSGRKIIVNFGLTVTKPTREEVQTRVSEVVRGFRAGEGL